MALMSIKKGKGGSNYAYANARVRAKKAKLLPPETFHKMLKMSLAEVTATVRESSYQEQVDALSARFSGIDLIESALNVNEEQTYAQVRHFTQGEAESLVGAFLDRYDFYAIKVILRGKHYGASQDEIMRELLVEDKEEYDFMRRLISDDVQGVAGVIEALASVGGRGRVYHQALTGAEKIRSNPGLSDYEDALDRAYYTNLLATLGGESADKKLLAKYVSMEIDGVNLLAVLRYRRAKLPWEKVEGLLVPGGRDLTKNLLRRLHENPSLEDVASELHATHFKEDLDAALTAGDLSEVDVAARRHLLGAASGFGHMHPLSILPIVDFLLRKRMEVRNLRAIARGKEAKLSESAIQSTLIL